MERAVHLVALSHPEYHPRALGDSMYVVYVASDIRLVHLTSKAVLVSKIVDFLNS